MFARADLSCSIRARKMSARVPLRQPWQREFENAVCLNLLSSMDQLKLIKPRDSCKAIVRNDMSIMIFNPAFTSLGMVLVCHARLYWAGQRCRSPSSLVQSFSMLFVLWRKHNAFVKKVVYGAICLACSFSIKYCIIFRVGKYTTKILLHFSNIGV